MTATNDDAGFKSELTGLIPHLRAFASTLCGNRAMADDLAQEALLKAWKARASYKPGTNMKAWSFTILRNLFYSQQRRAWRSQPLDQEVAEATLVANEDPTAPLELLAIRNALQALPTDQREALILVGAGGVSYEEAAQICECAVGTIKSRVSRARTALLELVENGTAGFNADDGATASRAFEDIVNEAANLTGKVG
ncbi:RNA polymerase sigma-70 factor, ECF subfamily protein [Parvularcula bermudensis HTCC2503]|uniref:RNA polymerase sigma-70 factor, ECF subfamily protein n=1 Tax=Parvularcula bermudensis (strain ATCC BAA-594 / HTCC2503 / KCTC 12087) TaxID=314260 RepID=E0TFG0_PARBH|nr:sigma-70 family RNA polymerase sigma factor [Parvularcula bermudensis]ADM10084.1 RNA polymerase sigma-70 factor, ECF subfamily protein [Parvularcula bermudensis HTCC2503]